MAAEAVASRGCFACLCLRASSRTTAKTSTVMFHHSAATVEKHRFAKKQFFGLSLTTEY